MSVFSSESQTSQGQVLSVGVAPGRENRGEVAGTPPPPLAVVGLKRGREKMVVQYWSCESCADYMAIWSKGEWSHEHHVMVM